MAGTDCSNHPQPVQASVASDASMVHHQTHQGVPLAAWLWLHSYALGDVYSRNSRSCRRVCTDCCSFCLVLYSSDVNMY